MICYMTLFSSRFMQHFPKCIYSILQIFKILTLFPKKSQIKLFSSRIMQHFHRCYSSLFLFSEILTRSQKCIIWHTFSVAWCSVSVKEIFLHLHFLEIEVTNSLSRSALRTTCSRIFSVAVLHSHHPSYATDSKLKRHFCYIFGCR